MRHAEFIDRIKKRYDEGLYLEAFELQAMYIEQLVRSCAKYIFSSVVYPIKLEDENEIILDEIEEKIGRYSFSEQINFIAKGKFITEEARKNLHAYRQKYNKVKHDLIGQITDQNLQIELKEVYEQADAMIEDNTFAEVVYIVETVINRLDEAKNKTDLSNSPQNAKINP